MSAPILIATSTAALQRPVIHTLGLVVGHAVVTADDSEFPNVEVGEALARHTAYTLAFTHARNAAMAELLADAKRLGANAIVDTRLEFKNLEPDSAVTICVSFTGTAVTI